MAWTILDCTFRDGGYYTNWDFSRSLVQNYLRTIENLPIGYIEFGYRNPVQANYAGEFYYLPHSTLQLFAETMASGTKSAVMIDAKNCSPEQIPTLLGGCQDWVDLVRMAVSPTKLEEGIALARAVKELGFEVALNLMYLSKLAGDYSVLLNFKDLGEIVDYVYLVDSFGACFPEQVKDAFQFAKAHLPQKLGFHGHDNINLAFANTLAALEAGADIIDSTVLGMGRGAGNLRTELIVAYLSQSLDKPIDLSSLADLLEIFQVMKDHHRWGAELPYIVSGLADLPQKEVMEWLGKKRYSTSTVVQTLQGKYQDVISSEPYPLLSDRLAQFGLEDIKTCVIVGGGSTAAEHSHAISEFVKQRKAVLIHSSMRNTQSYTGTEIPQILGLSGREAEKLKPLSTDHLNQQFLTYVLPSKTHARSSVPSDLTAQTVEVQPITRTNHNSAMAIVEQDSPLGIALSIAKILEVETIFLAGFDGYPGGNEVQKELAKEIQELLNIFSVTHLSIQLCSLTPTRYQVPQQSVYALLNDFIQEERTNDDNM
jgi:4-hydroxy 2-oxovalerate aldolase